MLLKRSGNCTSPDAKKEITWWCLCGVISIQRPSGSCSKQCMQEVGITTSCSPALSFCSCFLLSMRAVRSSASRGSDQSCQNGTPQGADRRVSVESCFDSGFVQAFGPGRPASSQLRTTVDAFGLWCRSRSGPHQCSFFTQRKRRRSFSVLHNSLHAG